jgi:hypothetical protein
MLIFAIVVLAINDKSNLICKFVQLQIKFEESFFAGFRRSREIGRHPTFISNQAVRRGVNPFVLRPRGCTLLQRPREECRRVKFLVVVATTNQIEPYCEVRELSQLHPQSHHSQNSKLSSRDVVYQLRRQEPRAIC